MPWHRRRIREVVFPLPQPPQMFSCRISWCQGTPAFIPCVSVHRGCLLRTEPHTCRCG